jgi:phage shock protein C
MSLNTLSLTGPFRSKNGLLFGVLRGIAEHYHISPFTLRLVFLIVSVFLVFWPMVIIYALAVLIMPLEPKFQLTKEADIELLLLGQADPAALVERLNDRFDGLEKKARRLEDIVTSKAYRANKQF